MSEILSISNNLNEQSEQAALRALQKEIVDQMEPFVWPEVVNGELICKTEEQYAICSFFYNDKASLNHKYAKIVHTFEKAKKGQIYSASQFINSGIDLTGGTIASVIELIHKNITKQFLKNVNKINKLIIR